MRRLLAGVLLLFAVAARAQSAPAKHILYRVHGPAGATVYLLGSVHLLTPDAATLPPVVDSAFARARAIYFETSLDSLQMRATELLPLAQLSGGATLRTVLSPAVAQRTDSILHLYGIGLDQIGQFKPWFVSLLLTQIAMQRSGFQPQLGVDVQLNARAHAANKPVRGLESVDFQMRLFDSLPAPLQERLLMAAKGPTETVAELESLKSAWATGNAARLDSMMNQPDMPPELMDMLVVRRNKSWLPRIEQMLQGKDDVLVVVGAGHLVGANGVVAMLRAKGYTVDQL